jgi:hypothetical protein
VSSTGVFDPDQHDYALTIRIVSRFLQASARRTASGCFSPYLYRARNLIERFFNKIKQCRRVATRYDKLAVNYLAFIKLASIRIWLRADESAPWCAHPGRSRLREKSNFVNRINADLPVQSFTQRFFSLRKSEIMHIFAPSRLGKRDVTANRHQT